MAIESSDADVKSSDVVSKSVNILRQRQRLSRLGADAEHLIKLNICCHCRRPKV